MKRYLTALLIVAAIGVSVGQTKTSVTFKVNMGVAAAKGKLMIATDKVYLSGSMNGWNATSIPMTRTASTTDTMYTVTLADMVVDSVYHYKFLAGSNWELLKDSTGKDDDNVHRLYKPKVNAADNILPAAFYSNDNVYPKYSLKPIKISFKCNMELDIAKGGFDPATDKVSLRAGFNGWAEGATVLKKPLSGTVYTYDTTMALIPGFAFDYVYTYSYHGNNATWESANTNIDVSEADYAAGTTTSSKYFDNHDKTSSLTGYTLYLETNCKKAKADIGGVQTPFPHGIKKIAVVGTEYPMVWPALGWPNSDTSHLVLWMNDSGTDGDKVANDSIWTIKINLLKGASFNIAYKYAVNYGMDGDNAGSNDNEIYLPGGDANHHLIILNRDVTTVWVHDVWGKFDSTKILTSVATTTNTVVKNYELSQNYPNPFNPSTTIKFSVPEAGFVSLKVYNLLGEEVATLVNDVKPASENTVSFDASHLASGLYIYRISAKNYTASKKMMLLK
jgi:hypothetical protein